MHLESYSSTKISRHVLLTAFLIASAIIVGTFGLSYYVAGHNGLPIGWDTPVYAGQISTVLSKGPIEFVQINGFYNFLYSEIASIPVLAGVSAITVEIFFPIILTVCLMGVSGYLAKRNLGIEAGVYTVLLSTIWFALYRVGTDLHPNLLAMVIVILALGLFPPWKTGEKSQVRHIGFYAMIFVASFVHIESVLFFSFIVIVTIVITEFKHTQKQHSFRIIKGIAPLVITLLPSSILFYFHLTNLVNYSHGNPVFLPPLPLELWLAYLGFLLPLAIYGLISAHKKNVTRNNDKPSQLSQTYTVLISVWAVASLVTAAINYVSPAFSIFSERALLLFPAPFIAAIGLKDLISRLQKNPRISKRTQKTIIGLSLGLLLASGWAITYSTVAGNHKVFLSESADQKLSWLANNKFTEQPIFVFYDYDEYAGHLAKLNNDWVQAIYGDHYSYVGRLDFLLSKQETPFQSVTSQTVSSMFMEKINKDGLFNDTEMLKHPIVIVEDFYLSSTLKEDYKGLLNEIHQGVFVVNMQEAYSSDTRIPLYSNMYNSEGHWYGIKYNWTESAYALEFYDPNPSGPKYFEVLIPSTIQGQYVFALRYMDGSASDLTLELNETHLGQIHYESTNIPRVFTANCTLSPGVNSLRVISEYDGKTPQYASLDYLEITRLPKTDSTATR